MRDVEGLSFLITSVIAGAVATAMIDVWQIVSKALFGIPRTNWAMVGRWFAHLPRGVVFHDSIAQAEPVRGELAIGWIAHYGVGIAYAAIYLALPLIGVIDGPAFGSAMAFALVTIFAGWLLLQPGMGAGWFASRTPNPMASRAIGVTNHVFFGLGLYAGVMLTAG